MTRHRTAHWREIPPATRAAFTLSIVAHAALMLWFGPVAIRAPQIAAFKPIEVSLVSEPAPRHTLKSVLMRSIPARTNRPNISQPQETPVADSATGQAHTAAPNPSEEPLVESRYDVRSLDNPRPPYPLAARRQGMEGRVLLYAHVRDDGRCTDVQLKQSSGYGLLDAAALQTVKNWRFIPASRGGVALASWVEVPITFQLRDAIPATN